MEASSVLDQMLELFLQNGLRPLSLLSETAELEREVNRSELTALLVMHFQGELTMSALAAELGAPLSTVTSLVKRLVRKGLINRNQSTKDQRIMLVDLTSEGKQLALQARTIMEDMFGRVQAALNQDELQQFLTLALKVGKALQGKGSKEIATKEQQLRKIQIDD
jgi:DNA-binding MarR family transcriptional regulator